MSVSSLQPCAAVLASARPERTDFPVGAGTSAATPEDRAKVSSLFGILLMRQMFDPVLEPVVKGLQGSGSGGGAMYGHLIKEALASALTQSGASGLTAGIERQFYPATPDRVLVAQKENS
jgi:hypothetical protein